MGRVAGLLPCQWHLTSVLILGVLAWGALASASTPVPITPEQAALAQSLLKTRCAQCHKVPKISAYSQAAWQFNLARMAPKAKLSEKETEALTRYINLTLFMNRPVHLP